MIEQIHFSLSGARIFNEDYSEGLDGRIRGIYIEPETGCLMNKYNLNHYGILSFDKMVTDEISELVKTELSRPENQPQLLDFSSPGPVEKAVQMAALRGFIRICLIELMVKGSISYSVWDMEGVMSEQVFKDYAYTYIKNEITRRESFKDKWYTPIEKLAGLSGTDESLRKIVNAELQLMPQLSKKIFDNRGGNYENWWRSIILDSDVSSEYVENATNTFLIRTNDTDEDNTPTGITNDTSKWL